MLEPWFGFNDVHTVNLLTQPLLGLRIKGGVDKAFPVLIINGREI
jgi:hypothetical protein